MFRPESLHLRPTRHGAAQGVLLVLLLAVGACAALLLGRPGGSASLSTALADEGKRADASCISAPLHPTRSPHPHNEMSARPSQGDEDHAPGAAASPQIQAGDPADKAKTEDEDGHVKAKDCPSLAPLTVAKAPLPAPTPTPVPAAVSTPAPVSAPAPTASAAAAPGVVPAPLPVTGETPLAPLRVSGTGSAPPPESLPVVNQGGPPVQTGASTRVGTPTPAAPAPTAPPSPPPSGPRQSAAPAPSPGTILPIPPAGPLQPITLPAPRIDLGPSSVTLWLAFSTIALVALVFGARLLLRSR